MQAEPVKPFPQLGSETKEQQVEQMFDEIAGKYDLLNHLLSCRLDIAWRRKVIKTLKTKKPARILDLATGTADLAIMAAKNIKNAHITGVDISDKMLARGREKIKRARLEGRITLINGNGESLPFSSDSFDAVTIAFGIRNYQHPARGLREMHRVLRPGGMAVLLEFSMPQRFPLKQAYRFYFRQILPLIGKAISGKRYAYSYLPESVGAFPQGAAFMDKMRESGLNACPARPVSGGIATIYTAEK